MIEMTTMMRNQSPATNENDVRMRSNRPSKDNKENKETKDQPVQQQTPQNESPEEAVSPTSSPTHTRERRFSTTCCFCWCCTPPCFSNLGSGRSSKGDNSPNSNMVVKNDQLSQSRSKELDSNSDREELLSLEDMKNWSESFDRLIRSNGGRRKFREFLRMEYSEENMLFWLACEELKREQNSELIEEKARLIYEDYISILSPKEVSLDSRVREVINQNMLDPSPHTFDEAQLQIYTLMHQDPYPRFLNSQLYKKLIEEASS
ncbi:regulator of G-protein signaling 17 isoform X1 [Octopus bimaculoides]|uniref:regulator of G-protein signaling 17 isoform X1 n=2 Tax=Octopus bimaculoides TaxID=37653 RepID=UPI00071CEEFB|nr:regulator of G-protein signaling 17 isoform X1 [Octopus bimaculoides]XP_052823067.1 regulator of G-protein signaling 17 isoform X1 [Octopus bimaculoides]XP_052823068.1 regulator of G-protein signaling 17 isoform X1 [Octopus bimaculoides]XP_052823069.1 regulator of G-protein signaling 17 isoform X1 [Octopus bimaculoides]XP_052823070.1 regulator of G-protein signaling 17 isoform X1 [Octopus bimaculoides]XP_052823071.1 regulator of G-protein signaling 17 isoform X1 [Octopus bimaculoides]XP_05|eukprot:XP_014787789.1 PREDICTED: regulator of G-protein signaling 17-like isoform X1 [Octopus bimaculoides]